MMCDGNSLPHLVDVHYTKFIITPSFNKQQKKRRILCMKHVFANQQDRMKDIDLSDSGKNEQLMLVNVTDIKVKMG